MDSKCAIVGELQATRRFFKKTIEPLTEDDSAFAPIPGLFTAAQQVAHVAQTVDWFIDGTFGPDGFSMDFEGAEKEVRAVTSLKKAVAWLDKAFDRAVKTVEEKSDAELAAPYPEGAILQGPKSHFVGAVVDHSAHHRGALAVYIRHLGKVPPIPYM